MMYTTFLLCGVFLCCVMLSPEVETLMAELVSNDIQQKFLTGVSLGTLGTVLIWGLKSGDMRQAHSLKSQIYLPAD